MATIRARAVISFEFDHDFDVDELASEWLNNNLSGEFDVEDIMDAELDEA